MFGLAMTDVAYAAPDKTNERDEEEMSVKDFFFFDDTEFDSTTAFLNVEPEAAEPAVEDMLSAIDVNDVIAYAKKYLGRPYVWGAKGPNAFDCSGFTSYVYRKFNVSLSPSAVYQSRQGVAVNRGEIRPGDLIFFKGRTGSGVGHVAMCIDSTADGDVTFIHAARGGVKIDKLTSSYYRPRYICTRRVIK